MLPATNFKFDIGTHWSTPTDIRTALKEAFGNVKWSIARSSKDVHQLRCSEHPNGCTAILHLGYQRLTSDWKVTHVNLIHNHHVEGNLL